MTAKLAAPFKPKDADLYVTVSSFEAAYAAYAEHQSRMERYWCLRWLIQENKSQVQASVLKGDTVRLNDIPLTLIVLGLGPHARGTQIMLDVLSLDVVTLSISVRVAQVLGATAAAGVLYLIATGKPGADIGGFATNGFGEHSPGKYGMTAALVCEVVMTAVFLIVILGATAKRAAGGFAGLAIGLCLTLIHLISIPVTNTSVNPARSTGPALFGPSYAVSELWLFWVAPIAGAIIGALIYRALLANSDD